MKLNWKWLLNYMETKHTLNILWMDPVTITMVQWMTLNVGTCKHFHLQLESKTSPICISLVFSGSRALWKICLTISKERSLYSSLWVPEREVVTNNMWFIFSTDYWILTSMPNLQSNRLQWRNIIMPFLLPLHNKQGHWGERETEHCVAVVLSNRLAHKSILDIGELCF